MALLIFIYFLGALLIILLDADRCCRRCRKGKPKKKKKPIQPGPVAVMPEPITSENAPKEKNEKTTMIVAPIEQPYASKAYMRLATISVVKARKREGPLRKKSEVPILGRPGSQDMDGSPKRSFQSSKTLSPYTPPQSDYIQGENLNKKFPGGLKRTHLF